LDAGVKALEASDLAVVVLMRQPIPSINQRKFEIEKIYIYG
jgi:hypothetical protein